MQISIKAAMRILRIWVLAVLVALPLVFGIWLYFCKNNALLRDQVISTLDADNPGRGPDVYKHDIQDQAMAYALFATAISFMDNQELARISADWLIDNGKNSNGYGWGLPYAWDAFSDGSVNPVDTVYGVTTAVAVRALLDVCELTGESRYCTVAQSALEYYKRFFTKLGDGGYFWYSDQSSDAYEVYNISAVLMGQYARAAKIFGRDDFMDLADHAFKRIWSARHDEEIGVWWNYAKHKESPNDLVHAVMVIQGIAEYHKQTGVKLDFSRMIDYLKSFLHPDMVTEFAPHAELSQSLLIRPARVWGLGALIGTLAEHGHLLASYKALQQLKGYQVTSGLFGIAPGTKDFSPRVQAYLLLGLVEQAYHCGCFIFETE